MPRKLIRKYMPDEHKLKSNRYLSWLGSHIHDPNLWHLTRKSVSKAFLVGLFCAFIPLPSQMLIAAVLALVVRSNLPISVSLVWITNPITIPPMFYFTYWVGTQILGTPLQDVQFELTWEWFTNGLSAIWLPLILGSAVCGIVSGSLGYILMQRFWVWHVNSSWRKRKNRKSINPSDVCLLHTEDSETESKKPD
ncbi:DUF2062 domain-containing protein [Amphritea balenae]|uniref:DUF2062 domain-containing protein n=1 Tax=Amphritea balenae TaxID=452629 RepID=A0A3P1STX5_9GAMM|nr:DUF2062 domain-containing protein [Amphritea balenae]RRD00667.1 DUF2062 domain-containing protein [Amphritea balenae]GGK68889.1 hypothetical protein GCM10007941_18780 [Amphritea balenae]